MFLCIQEYIFHRFGAGFYRGMDYYRVYISDTDWIQILALFNSSFKKSSIFHLSRDAWKRVLVDSELGVSFFNTESALIYFFKKFEKKKVVECCI